MARSTHQLVEVTWVDIFGKNDGWTSLDDWTDPGEAVATTVGYLLPGLKEGYVVLAGTIMDWEGLSVHDLSFFPESIVRNVRTLSRSKAL